MMPLQTQRPYATLPGLPERGPLPPMVSVVLPIARTNLVTNPSFEMSTTGWTASGGSIARSTAQQYHGAYSLAVTPSAGNNSDGAIYSSATLIAGSDYAYSIKFKAQGNSIGQIYALGIYTLANASLHLTYFVATGRWQWIRGVYHEVSSVARQLFITKVTHAGSDVFYIDGAQIELITGGILDATTYIDGDQPGLLAGQQPPPYGWNGTPHASTSYRTALTRAGGYVLNLYEAYTFLLTGLIGLGMAVPNNVSIPYSVLDGARYLRATKPPRTISIPGRFQSETTYDLSVKQSAMRAAFDRDLVPIQQPLVLQVDPQDDCGNIIGDTAQIQCVYAGGLDGDQGNYPIEDAAPTFTMYVPYLIGGSAGATLGVQSTVANARGIIKRSPDGTWSAVGAGVSAGNPVYSILVARDGKVYAGGGFTAMSGVANTAKIAYFDPSDNAWHAMGSGASGGDVYVLVEGTDGSIYAGGDFTGMGGVASTKTVARWDGVNWNALGSGGGGSTTSVRAMAVDGSGNLFIGGNFTDIGGSGADYLAYYNPSANTWSVVVSAAALNGTVYALILKPGTINSVYVGGAFTNAGGVAAADYVAFMNGVTSAYSALGTGMDNDVNTLVLQPNGILYAGGAFTTAGGVAVTYNAQWNGTGWSAIGSGLNALIYDLTSGPGQSLYMGGAFSTAGGFTLSDGLALWTGSAFAFPDVDLGSAATVYAIATAPDGTIYVGSDATGSSIAASVTTVTNTNKQYVYPVVTIKGPSSGNSRVYGLINLTTGAGIYLNMTLAAQETATLVIDPQQFSITSNIHGDIASAILAGSNPALFYLAPGANSLSFFAADSSVTAVVSWQRRYNGVQDLVN